MLESRSTNSDAPFHSRTSTGRMTTPLPRSILSELSPFIFGAIPQAEVPRASGSNRAGSLGPQGGRIVLSGSGIVGVRITVVELIVSLSDP